MPAKKDVRIPILAGILFIYKKKSPAPAYTEVGTLSAFSPNARLD